MNKNIVTLFYIVRHGQTNWNIEKKVQGQCDIPINQVGEAQAVETAQLLKQVKFDQIFSSDLVRAKKTAEIVKAERNIKIQLSPNLRERDYSQFNGAPSEKGYEIEKSIAEWEQSGKTANRPYPNVESDQELCKRILDYLTEIANNYKGATILIVTHAGPLRRILTYLQYVSSDQMPIIQNAAYLKLHYSSKHFSIDQVYGITK